MEYTASSSSATMCNLFPQLEAVPVNQPQPYQNMLQLPSGQDYYQQQALQDSMYYYYQQLAQQENYSRQQQTLHSEEVLFPTAQQPVYTQPSYTHQYQQQQQQQSPNSLCYTPHAESPYSIGSDSFNYGQQYSAQYATPSYTTTSSVRTPCNEVFDIAIQNTSFHQPALPSPMIDNICYSSRVVVKEEPEHVKTSCTFSSPPSSCSSYSTDNETDHEDEPVTSSTTKSGPLFRCEYKGCTKTFTRTYNLKSHRRTHTDEKPFTCNICPKAFARQHDRNRHAKLHLGLKPYPCQFCEKSFARQDALNRHLKRDKKNSDKGSYMYPPPCLLVKMRQQQATSMKKRKHHVSM